MSKKQPLTQKERDLIMGRAARVVFKFCIEQDAELRVLERGNITVSVRASGHVFPHDVSRWKLLGAEADRTIIIAEGKTVLDAMDKLAHTLDEGMKRFKLEWR